MVSSLILVAHANLTPCSPHTHKQPE